MKYILQWEQILSAFNKAVYTLYAFLAAAPVHIGLYRIE